MVLHMWAIDKQIKILSQLRAQLAHFILQDGFGKVWVAVILP